MHAYGQRIGVKRRGRSGLRRQRGAVSLVELMVVMIISALIAIYSLDNIAAEAEETVAAASAAYLNATTAALQRYSLINFVALQADPPVVNGFANPKSPTLAELKAAGFASPNMSDFAPTQQAVRFDLIKSGTCPGNSCRINAMACLTGPFTLRGKFREDLATTVMMKMNGQGGRSQIGAGTVLRGPGAFIQTANPLGDVEGVVCGQNVFDTAVYDQFVKMNDTRDPNLQGGLTVNGTIPGSTFTTQTNGSANITNQMALGATAVSREFCSDEGRLAWDNDPVPPTLLTCSKGHWVPTGITLSSAGMPCSPEGVSARNSLNQTLICRTGRYRLLSDMTGQGGIVTSGRYAQGELVPYPDCDDSTTARLEPLSLINACDSGGANCGNDTGSVRGQLINGNEVLITGSDGEPVDASSPVRLTVQTRCTSN